MSENVFFLLVNNVSIEADYHDCMFVERRCIVCLVQLVLVYWKVVHKLLEQLPEWCVLQRQQSPLQWHRLERVERRATSNVSQTPEWLCVELH